MDAQRSLAFHLRSFFDRDLGLCDQSKPFLLSVFGIVERRIAYRAEA
jgi:hypothetical protein